MTALLLVNILSVLSVGSMVVGLGIWAIATQRDEDGVAPTAPAAGRSPQTAHTARLLNTVAERRDRYPLPAPRTARIRARRSCNSASASSGA